MYLKTSRPDAIRLHPSGLRAAFFNPDDRRDGPADVARSIAEGVGGLCFFRKFWNSDRPDLGEFRKSRIVEICDSGFAGFWIFGILYFRILVQTLSLLFFREGMFS